jgi:hypothetical protein
MNDVIEAPPIIEHAIDAGDNRCLIRDIHTHHRDRCTAGNLSERAIGCKNAHATFAQFCDSRPTKTAGCARHERNR